MNANQRKTLQAVFTDPVSGSIKWRDVESMLLALGAEMSEGSGSRVRFMIRNQILFVHRPHPSPDTDKGAVKTVRRYLISLGIRP